MEEEYGDSSPVFKEDLAATVAAQFNATLAGNKPAFLETVPGLTPSFAKDLPPGVRFVEAGGIECIYNEAAVARELNLPEGADVESIVRKRLEHHQKMEYNQPPHPMDEEIANKMIKEGKAALFDENGKFLRWLKQEEKAKLGENFDMDYMCPKSIAELKRRMGQQPLWTKKALPQQ